MNKIFISLETVWLDILFLFLICFQVLIIKDPKGFLENWNAGTCILNGTAPTPVTNWQAQNLKVFAIVVIVIISIAMVVITIYDIIKCKRQYDE